jgi:hypothetical protein
MGKYAIHGYRWMAKKLGVVYFFDETVQMHGISICCFSCMIYSALFILLSTCYFREQSCNID